MENLVKFNNEINQLSELFLAEGILIPSHTLLEVYSKFKGFKNWQNAQIEFKKQSTNDNSLDSKYTLLNLILYQYSNPNNATKIQIIGNDGREYRIVWFNSESQLEELEQFVLEGLDFEESLKECDTSIIEILPLDTNFTEDGVFIYLSDIFHAQCIDNTNWFVQNFFTINQIK